MKPLLLSLLLFLAFHSKATNDTLTRAQVYNFNVGDTFDYKNEISDVYGSYRSADYVRMVITNTYFSPDNDSLFITRQWQCYGCYNTQLIVDTLMIDSLQTYQVFFGTDTMSNPTLTITEISQYHGRTINSISWPTFYPARSFGNGLGLVSSSQSVSGEGPGCCFFDTSLIYYSKGAEKWGIPYYIVEGIANLSAQHVLVNLYPTMNDGQFKIKITNGNSPNYQLTVYDLTGRAIKATALNNGVNNIEMVGPAKGMYLWSVTGEGAILQSGKLIIQ